MSYEIIVVDNASREDEAAKIHELYPTVISIRSNENGGFPVVTTLASVQQKANTFSLSITIHISNPMKSPTWWNDWKVVRKSGACLLKIRFAFPPQHIQFAGFTPLTKITLRNNMLGFDCPDDGSYDTPHPTPYLHGAA